MHMQLFAITEKDIASMFEVSEEPAGRQLLQDEADTVDLDFDIVFFADADSPPPNPPGVDALPNLPPNPPPMPPISVLDAPFGKRSGACGRGGRKVTSRKRGGGGGGGGGFLLLHCYVTTGC